MKTFLLWFYTTLRHNSMHVRRTYFNMVSHYLHVNVTNHLLLDLSATGLHKYLLSTSCRGCGVLLHVCRLTELWDQHWTEVWKMAKTSCCTNPKCYATAHASNARLLNEDAWLNCWFTVFLILALRQLFKLLSLYIQYIYDTSEQIQKCIYATVFLTVGGGGGGGGEVNSVIVLN